jgi:hypothetical protein
MQQCFQTFGRACIKDWFGIHGLVCPLNEEPISPIIVRNYRTRAYLDIWEEATGGAKVHDVVCTKHR